MSSPTFTVFAPSADMETISWDSNFVSQFVRDLNSFHIYKNSTKTLSSNYIYGYSLPFEAVKNKVEWTITFQKYWYHSITISIFYYIAIRMIQHFMINRRPFELKTPLFLWNAGLAVFSIICFVRFSEDFFHNLKLHGLVYSICHTCNPDSVAAFWSLAFAISKIVELGDTLFIVLRKRPLIFLHYYHHVAVLIYTTHSGAEHTAPGQAFISMNVFAHSVMYTYYSICSLGYRLPKWVSVGVTTIQTTQMFFGVAVSCLVYKIKIYDDMPCQQSMANLYLAFLIYVTFAVLFVQYFLNAYVWKSKRHPVSHKSAKKIN